MRAWLGMRNCCALQAMPKATFGIAGNSIALPPDRIGKSTLRGTPSVAPPPSNGRSPFAFQPRARHGQRCMVNSFHGGMVWLYVVACASLWHVCTLPTGGARETCACVLLVFQTQVKWWNLGLYVPMPSSWDKMRRHRSRVPRSRSDDEQVFKAHFVKETEQTPLWKRLLLAKPLHRRALDGIARYKYASGGYTILDKAMNEFWDCTYSQSVKYETCM